MRNNEGKLKYCLDFGKEPYLDELTYDWKIVPIAADRIELGDSSNDLLIFEKK